ncbi:hypothetical protein CNBD0330 [Cryptococcus deneoformans B-3501A]|uniref:Endoplasmic reticulum protein n=1 Tax=Cryptococcus deneoformans (strain JEC21 / ATCC MYA-565) TaxID=214684 RepID=Q5KHL3_CRYD1|nr:conserved hypothetical protein [Cryptococcus neoformans var. neoformans JEC21]XP_776212.1 hypothetical protein CNBD0330 [Cryptococcus neoformans var. neoformans B-3501A]AAW43349.1 conserved hypothetical protein [Cryptococcus neoformans var. neoformans JEC21]EAL21565.1 hypothetical protein CNBD0330 [Cryptococcus neoformans var. neoformans B-3501A]
MPSITLLPFLHAVPPATRALTAALLLPTAAALLLTHLGTPPAALPWLLLVPAHSWKYPWVLLTAAFVELGLINALVSAVALPLACRYLERVWGARELLRFCCITVVGSNLIAFGFSWIVWLLFGSEDALYGLPYHGMTGLQVGFLVAFTQLIPEHQVQLLGKIKLRVKSLPGIHLLISNVLVILLGPSPFMLIQFGFFVAWVYLRFFKPSPDGGLFRGDRSETFAFQYWFPPVVRPYISVVANHVYTLATRIHLVQAWDAPAGEYSLLPGPGSAASASGMGSGVGGLGGGARAEAERRRALALKALDARLASTPSPAPAPAPVPAAVPAENASGLGAGSAAAKDIPAPPAASVEPTPAPAANPSPSTANPSTATATSPSKPTTTIAPTLESAPLASTQPTQPQPQQGQPQGQGKKGKGKGKGKKPSSSSPPPSASQAQAEVEAEEKEKGE